MLLAAAVTVDALCRSVDFIDFLGTGLLVETIDILRDHAGELAGFLHLRELDVRDVRLDRAAIHLLPVIFEEYFRLVIQAAVTEKIFRRILVELHVVLVVKPVFASEIRNTAFCRDTCSAEKHYGSCFVQDALEF